MKTVISIIAGLAFGILGASPAFAWHLIPESTDFTGSGTTSSTLNGITLKCTASLTGDTDSSGIGYITAGSFSGEVGCSYVTLQNLPWTVTAVTHLGVHLANVEFDTPIGNCGPGTLKVNLQSKGVFYYRKEAFPGGCTLSGTITTTPAITISR
jgi:hypothetical protein